jgi:hypothetical protein
MSWIRMGRLLVGGLALATALTACASGRVRGAQGTEMGQAREYEPESKAEPPIGNVERTSGSMTQPDPYPVLEVDLERRREPPPSPEPEPSRPPPAENP